MGKRVFSSTKDRPAHKPRLKSTRLIWLTQWPLNAEWFTFFYVHKFWALVGRLGLEIVLESLKNWNTSRTKTVSR